MVGEVPCLMDRYSCMHGRCVGKTLYRDPYWKYMQEYPRLGDVMQQGYMKKMSNDLQNLVMIWPMCFISWYLWFLFAFPFSLYGDSFTCFQWRCRSTEEESIMYKREKAEDINLKSASNQMRKMQKLSRVNKPFFCHTSLSKPQIIHSHAALPRNIRDDS